MSTATMLADSTSSGELGKSKKRKKGDDARRVKKSKKVSKKGKENAVAVSTDEKNDLDLDVPLEPIASYLKTRSEMVEQLFHCVSGASLHRSLPDVLKDMPLEELKMRCLQQLEVMSRKRILRILQGDDPADISSSSTEDSDDNGSNSKAEGKRKSEEHDDKDDFDADIDDLDMSTPPTQMEIFELEMRARAIKAMLKAQGAGEDDNEEDLVSEAGDEKGEFTEYTLEEGGETDEQNESVENREGEEHVDSERGNDNTFEEQKLELYEEIKDDSNNKQKEENYSHGEHGGADVNIEQIAEDKETKRLRRKERREFFVHGKGFKQIGRKNKILRERRVDSISECSDDNEKQLMEDPSTGGNNNDVMSNVEMESVSIEIESKRKLRVKSESSIEEGEIKDDMESEDADEGTLTRNEKCHLVASEVVRDLVNEVSELIDVRMVLDNILRRVHEQNWIQIDTKEWQPACMDSGSSSFLSRHVLRESTSGTTRDIDICMPVSVAEPHSEVATCDADHCLVSDQRRVWMDTESESDESEDEIIEENRGNESDGSGSSFFDEVEKNRDTSVYVDVETESGKVSPDIPPTGMVIDPLNVSCYDNQSCQSSSQDTFSVSASLLSEITEAVSNQMKEKGGTIYSNELSLSRDTSLVTHTLSPDDHPLLLQKLTPYATSVKNNESNASIAGYQTTVSSDTTPSNCRSFAIFNDDKAHLGIDVTDGSVTKTSSNRFLTVTDGVRGGRIQREFAPTNVEEPRGTTGTRLDGTVLTGETPSTFTTEPQKGATSSDNVLSSDLEELEIERDKSDVGSKCESGLESKVAYLPESVNQGFNQGDIPGSTDNRDGKLHAVSEMSSCSEESIVANNQSAVQCGGDMLGDSRTVEEVGVIELDGEYNDHSLCNSESDRESVSEQGDDDDSSNTSSTD